MITTIKKGTYKLIESRSGTKMLLLDDKDSFAWIYAKGIGSVLAMVSFPKDYINLFSQGEYGLFDVSNEPELTDLEHLELQAGEKKWQGYLLLSGLPTEKHRRSRIIPTDELIDESVRKEPAFWQDRIKVFSDYVRLANNPMLMVIY